MLQSACPCVVQGAQWLLSTALLQWMGGVLLVTPILTTLCQDTTNDDEKSFQFFLSTEKNTDRRKNHEKT
jgi:hypothetical protein